MLLFFSWSNSEGACQKIWETRVIRNKMILFPCKCEFPEFTMKIKKMFSIKELYFGGFKIRTANKSST